jgi:hypothetical protein
MSRLYTPFPDIMHALTARWRIPGKDVFLQKRFLKGKPEGRRSLLGKLVASLSQVFSVVCDNLRYRRRP